MPANIIVGLIALLVALVLYTIGSWGSFRSATVTRRLLVYLWIGLAFDALATAMMAIQAGGLDLAPLSDLVHTLLAFTAMFGMLAAAIAGTRAVATANEALRTAVARLVIAPWALWVFVFVWGMVSRGSQRLG